MPEDPWQMLAVALAAIVVVGLWWALRGEDEW